jgi:hypothetical protein
MDGAGGTANQANRIAAMITGFGDEQVLVLVAFAHKARPAFMHVGAAAHALDRDRVGIDSAEYSK